eukprot:sb/3463945/
MVLNQFAGYSPGPGISQFSLTVENDGNMVIRDYRTDQVVWEGPYSYLIFGDIDTWCDRTRCLYSCSTQFKRSYIQIKQGSSNSNRLFCQANALTTVLTRSLFERSVNWVRPMANALTATFRLFIVTKVKAEDLRKRNVLSNSFLLCTMKFVLLSLLVACLALGTGAIDCDKTQGRLESCFERGYRALRKHWWSCGGDTSRAMDRKDKLYCRIIEKDFYKSCTVNDMERPKIDCGPNCRDGVCYKMYGENLRVPSGTTVWSENEKYAIVAQYKIQFNSNHLEIPRIPRPLFTDRWQCGSLTVKGAFPTGTRTHSPGPAPAPDMPTTDTTTSPDLLATTPPDTLATADTTPSDTLATATTTPPDTTPDTTPDVPTTTTSESPTAATATDIPATTDTSPATATTDPEPSAPRVKRRRLTPEQLQDEYQYHLKEVHVIVNKTIFDQLHGVEGVTTVLARSLFERSVNWVRPMANALKATFRLFIVTKYSRTPIYRDARGKGFCPVNRGAPYIVVK